MKKKHFLITVSMQPEKDLKVLTYKSQDYPDLPEVISRFPAIPLLEWYLAKDDTDIRITAVGTDDDNGRSRHNLVLLKEELKDLSVRLSKTLEIKDEEMIWLRHNETEEKQIETLRRLNSIYEKDTEVYADITYGTKVTPICIFASLVYGEKVKGAEIGGIIYGLYNFGTIAEGTIYDIRSMYELNMFIHAATALPNPDVDAMIDSIWGKNENR